MLSKHIIKVLSMVQLWVKGTCALTRQMTPRYSSWYASKSRSFKRPSGLPFGGGMYSMIAGRMASRPFPEAEHRLLVPAST